METIKYEDGSLYKSEISENGIKNGIGMLITVDNAIYMGKWKNDIHDEEGTYLYPDGERYEGGNYGGEERWGWQDVLY